MALVVVDKLSYRYPDGRQALSEVSFVIRRGERIGLLGLNGAGKSTLLVCLAGVLKPEGRISVDGDRRRTLGLVFQDPNDQLFMTTVYDDVAFGPQNLGLTTDDVRSRVKQALQLVDAAGYEERLTHHLSFGEKKRVALATVLAMQPELLLLDEPTSNLDPKRRREFIKIIQNTRQAALIATHDLDLVRQVCDRVLILQAGRLVVEGGLALLDDLDLMRRMELI